MEKKYKGNFGELTINISGNKLTGTYGEEGTIEGSFIDNQFNGTWSNKGQSGLLNFTLNDDKLEGTYKQGLDEGPMKGKWKGKLLSSSESDSQNGNEDDENKDLDNIEFTNYKHLNLLVVDDNVKECYDIYEGVKATFDIVTDEWETLYCVQYRDPDQTISNLKTFDEYEELYDFIGEKIMSWTNMQKWEADGLVLSVFDYDYDVLEEEEVRYFLSDGGDYDYDSLKIDMKGLGLINSRANKIKISNNGIDVNGNTVNSLGDIMGYVDSENDEIILI